MNDHINIYSKSEDILGRQLSNFYKCDVYTLDGLFNSVEGYWYWLGCRDDRLRNLWGFKAKQYGREQEQTHSEEHFEDLIKVAITNKILLNDDIKKGVIESSLPFDHYYKYGDKIVRPKKYWWIVQHIEYVRSQLKL